MTVVRRLSSGELTLREAASLRALFDAVWPDPKDVVTFALGALGTGLHAFYGRLGWTRWKGPTFVRTDAGIVPTPEEGGYVLVRLTPTSPELDLTAPISCDWRPVDVW